MREIRTCGLTMGTSHRWQSRGMGAIFYGVPEYKMRAYD